MQGCSSLPCHPAHDAAGGDAWGAALRYALLAEQGNPSAMVNLAWLLHRGAVHAGPDRHALALPLWLRAAERNHSEGALLAGHAYRQGARLGLAGGGCKAGGGQLTMRTATRAPWGPARAGSQPSCM